MVSLADAEIGSKEYDNAKQSVVKVKSKNEKIKISKMKRQIEGKVL